MDEGQRRDGGHDARLDDAESGRGGTPTDRPPDEPFVVPAYVYSEEDQAELAGSRRRVPRTLLVGLGVLVLLGGVYAADVLLSRGEVPRGTVVAGQQVGGLSTAAAEERLRSTLEPRATAPIPIVAGDVTTELDPATAGLTLDWEATLAQAGDPPLNPVTRVRSFFTEREVEVVSAVDTAALEASVDGLRAQIDRPVVEGSVVFEGTTPVATQPAAGQTLDAGIENATLVDRWLDGTTVELPVVVQEPTVTAEAVDAALAQATTAVSEPFTVTGQEGATATLQTDTIAEVLSFPAGDGGTLTATLDGAGVIELLTPELADTETEAVNATVRLAGGSPEVVPAVDGLQVNWEETLPDPVAQITDADRTVEAVYVVTPPDVTTEAAQNLGITEVIGEFTTDGFAQASGVNIRRAAEEINGAVVLPGDQFSLNGYTGERGAAQGYVESGIISNGRSGTGIGGGISQLATTLYNATYFAGMTDIEHQEHSFYISRYPAGREATVFTGSIDVVFGVPTTTGVLIQTIGTSTDITVRIWGTKTVDVESVRSDRRSFTSPETLRIPAEDDCSPSDGGQGFTIDDTRVITNAASGAEVSRETRTVRYNPIPIVECI